MAHCSSFHPNRFIFGEDIYLFIYYYARWHADSYTNTTQLFKNFKKTFAMVLITMTSNRHAGEFWFLKNFVIAERRKIVFTP